MSKISLFLFFLSCWTLAGAQNYLPLGGRDAVWQMENHQVTGWQNPPVISHYFAFYTDSSQADTLMNNKRYHFLRTLGCQAEYAYRSDSLGHYFFRTWNDTTDRLICDISAQTGDTIHNVAFYEYAITNLSTLQAYHDIIVDSTSYYSPYGRQLKVVHGHTVDTSTFSIYYTGPVTVTWIESIGSVHGLVNTLSCWAYDEFYSCMSMNDTTWFSGSLNSFFWQTQSPAPCGLVIDRIDEQALLVKSVVYPNPFHDHIRIQNTSAKSFEYELYSVTGQCLLRGRSFESATISLPVLPSGAYLLRWKDDAEWQQQRIVKVE